MVLAEGVDQLRGFLRQSHDLTRLAEPLVHVGLRPAGGTDLKVVLQDLLNAALDPLPLGVEGSPCGVTDVIWRGRSGLCAFQDDVDVA